MASSTQVLLWKARGLKGAMRRHTRLVWEGLLLLLRELQILGMLQLRLHLMQ